MPHLPVSLTLLCLLLLLTPRSGFAAPHSCPNQPEIQVYSDNPATISEICQAAGRATAFLARFGLTPRREIRFNLIEQRIDSHGYLAYGSYDSRTDAIELMTYDAIMAGSEDPRMYDEPFDRIHYSGAIAHEVAHAVVQHNLVVKPISTGPQEYLAHSTQLAVLPDGRKEAIIRAMDVEPWESGDVISDIYMAIEPGKFAVKSYRHLTTMKNPEDFVRILLNSNWFYVYVP